MAHSLNISDPELRGSHIEDDSLQTQTLNDATRFAQSVFMQIAGFHMVVHVPAGFRRVHVYS